MVHLTTVPNDSDISSPLGHSLEKVKLEPPREDGAHVSVYGSRFAAEELPRHEMPDHEMPKEIAYRMIRDELSLDGNPMLNLASFVTTYMVSKKRGKANAQPPPVFWIGRKNFFFLLIDNPVLGHI